MIDEPIRAVGAIAARVVEDVGSRMSVGISSGGPASQCKHGYTRGGFCWRRPCLPLTSISGCHCYIVPFLVSFTKGGYNAVGYGPSMDNSPNLALPYLAAAQAQKHVTHNEALRALDALVQLTVLDRDLAVPPTSPRNGDRYIVPAPSTGAWAGQSGRIAAFQDDAWAFLVPKNGWLAWVVDEGKIVVFNAMAWSVFGGSGNASVNPTPLVGVNAMADTNNRLAVASPGTLFNHDGDGHRLAVNKANVGATASLLFQDNFSGRAEMGLTGNDDFRLKVSADGSTWKDAIVVNRTSGSVSLPLTAGRELLQATRTYYVNPTGSDANDGRTATTPFQTIAKAYMVISSTLDFGGKTVLIQLADGIYADGLYLAIPWVGGGALILQGNATVPSNVTITPGSFGAYGVLVSAPLSGALNIQHLKLACGVSAIHHEAPGLLRFSNIDFGACGSFHIYTIAPGARIEASGNYTISGPAQIHWMANGQGLISVASRTIALVGTPAFSVFAYATRLSQIQAPSNIYNGSATGTRYIAENNSVIYVAGDSATALPGASAGSVATGGQYA